MTAIAHRPSTELHTSIEEDNTYCAYLDELYLIHYAKEQNLWENETLEATADWREELENQTDTSFTDQAWLEFVIAELLETRTTHTQQNGI